MSYSDFCRAVKCPNKVLVQFIFPGSQMSLLGSPLRKCINITLEGPMIMTMGFFVFVLFCFGLISRFGCYSHELTIKDHRFTILGKNTVNQHSHLIKKSISFLRPQTATYNRGQLYRLMWALSLYLITSIIF